MSEDDVFLLSFSFLRRLFSVIFSLSCSERDFPGGERGILFLSLYHCTHRVFPRTLKPRNWGEEKKKKKRGVVLTPRATAKRGGYGCAQSTAVYCFMLHIP